MRQSLLGNNPFWSRPLLLLTACLLGSCQIASGDMADLGPADPLGSELHPWLPPDDLCFVREIDLDTVLARGVLRAGLPNDTTSYFLWRGQVLGFEYELLEAFADDLGVELEPVLVQSVEDRHRALQLGQVDVIAGRLSDLEVLGVTYSLPLLEAGGVVLQKVPDHGESELLEDTGDLPEVRSTTLIVAPDHGWEEAMHEAPLPPLRLRALPPPASSETIANTVARDGSNDGLVRRDIGELLTASRPEILNQPALEEVRMTAHVGFASEATQLQAAFDDWLMAEPERLESLRQRYFEDRESHRERVAEPTFTYRSGVISPYDDLFRQESRGAWPDWQLVAAVAFQESRFNPNARSWAGARGLMQLMPRTARDVGVRDPHDPRQAVRGAVKYLRWLDDWWVDQEADPNVREELVLASYNAGIGHVADARRLAEATGRDPEEWDDVATALLLLQKPRWYRSDVVKYGYVRGTEPVDYVDEILYRARAYRSFEDLAQ